MTPKDHVHMGIITRPHGIRGELCVDWYADSPEFLRQTFYLQRGDEPLRKVESARVRMHKGRPLLTLPFIQDRTAAESMRGANIYVHRNSLPELSPEEMYLYDIIGYNIIIEQSEQCVGTLEAVQFPSEEQMLWVIRANAGYEILFPAVEEFIVSFDEEKQSVLINPPEGLLELYLEEGIEKPSKNVAKKTHKKAQNKSPQKTADTIQAKREEGQRKP